MSPTAVISESNPLLEQIDDLATRLLVDGTLDLEDLLELNRYALEKDQGALAAAVGELAQIFTAALPASELAKRLTDGIEHLRKLGTSQEQPPDVEAAQSLSAEPAQRNSLAEDEDLIREFITESTEHLANIEGQTLILERNAGDAEAKETLNAVFRAFHTIKGLAGFLEFTAIQSLAHEVETLLDLARNGDLLVTPGLIDVVLESTDAVRQELANVEAHLAGRAALVSQVDEALLKRIRHSAQGKTEVEQIPTEGAPDQSLSAVKSETSVQQQEAASPSEPRARTSAETAATLRIDTNNLDQLMDMVGEMVIAQTLIGHSPALTAVTDSRFLSDLSQLARITADVQRIATGMRMVPIGTQFQKTARVIRDLSRRAGKQIAFETSGEETEVDKTVAEEISDPLLHMVRNSIDHGIETPAERAAMGKDPTAHIRLSACHESGHIVISISDDGRGLNRDKILAKAVERGLVQPGAQMSDGEVFLLIFEAGFSTAEKLTDISGRGVGMDVVRRHVQALRGTIDIHSKQGEGTTFFLKLPLTLAIIEGLVVVVGDQRFILPIFSVKEMFRPTPDMISTVRGTSEMVLVRDSLLPVVRLHQRLKKEPRTTVLTEGTLIVAEAQGKTFCLFVDDLIGKQEVVIKNLGSTFRHVTGVAGCAILGDGRVGLILDMLGIFKGRAD
jgi:two-component system chemotaxis sensor kinase CheA